MIAEDLRKVINFIKENKIEISGFILSNEAYYQLHRELQSIMQFQNTQIDVDLRVKTYCGFTIQRE